MNVICIYQPGNLFDNKEGRIVNINEVYITRVLRAENNVVISKDNHLFDQKEIQELLELDDELEDNYCHGWYRVIP